MRFLKGVAYFFKILLIFIFLAAIFLFGLSFSGELTKKVPFLYGENFIALSSGEFPESTTDLKAVVTAEDLALLDQFASLSSADFSGSTCYSEIMQWAEAHPAVSVRYTVPLPNGTVMENSSSVAELSSLRHEDVGTAISALRNLPQITAINLGSSSQSSSPVTAEDVAAFQTAYPSAGISYSVDFLGKEWPIGTETVDLTGLMSAQVPEAANGIALLPNVKSIRIADNATTDGSLQWSDLTTISHAAPNAAMDYKFSVCGVNATTADTSLDLSNITPADVGSLVAVLPGMTQLQYLNLGHYRNGLSFADLQAIANACPQTTISMVCAVYDKEFNLADEVLDLNHIRVQDNGEDVKNFLPYMKNLKTLDMDSCGVPDQAMAEIRDAYPNINVVWRVWFGSEYSVRTDVVKILASKPSKGGDITNSNSAGLYYCTKVRYLDLGHNDELTDFSFVRNMPDLQLVVISMTGISDLSPFSSCSELIYLEMGNTRVSDISPLAACTKLRHLNIGTNKGISDITAMYDIPLLRFWIGVGDPVPQEQIDTYRSLHPECEVNTTVPTGLERNADGSAQNEGYTSENWKIYQRYLTQDWAYYSAHNMNFPAQRPLGYYKVIYNAFQYNLADASYAFSWNDPLYNEHAEGVEPAHMKIVDVSILFEEWHDHDILEPIYPEDELNYG
ncbi:MAG: hypothetical protein IJG40_08625 [Oscillospiraceae bacterium]|nr:hypothetical protein [Oscillospiraceae bacterium]